MLRVLKAGNASAHRAGNSSVTFLLRRSAGSVAFRPKDSACLSLKLLRNVAPNAESRSVRCGSVSVLKESPKRWRAKKELKKMKKSNAVRVTFWLATIFAVVFLMRAESGDKRTSVTPQKEHATARLRIFDQNGQ